MKIHFGSDALTQPIKHASAIRGTITVPGDKSISHRALLFAAIAEGKTMIHNLSSSADVMSTLHCLRQLQIGAIEKNRELEIVGTGKFGFKASHNPLDCGNSGTTIRLLSGILAAQPFTSTLVGDESLSKRPMKRVIEPLTKMGAHISSEPGGFPPLVIHGQQLKPINYQMPIASAQLKSCVLLAGLYAAGTTTVIEPYPSRDHTERMLRDFGINVTADNTSVSIHGPAKLFGSEVVVPGDISSAAFFIAAALMVPDS
ncbi:MAG TPA: 3-phosphoshikimate 1-carboxyvinyltransferase, partial [bacterium]